MANGRRALSSSASLGTLGKSLLCQSGAMWITELARNTITAESRIGSHSDSTLIMETPLYSYGSRLTWPAQATGGAGGTLTKRAPPDQIPPRGAPAPSRLR